MEELIEFACGQLLLSVRRLSQSHQALAYYDVRLLHGETTIAEEKVWPGPGGRVMTEAAETFLYQVAQRCHELHDKGWLKVKPEEFWRLAGYRNEVLGGLEWVLTPVG